MTVNKHDIPPDDEHDDDTTKNYLQPTPRKSFKKDKMRPNHEKQTGVYTM